MKYFTDKKNDIEGYMENLQKIDSVLDQHTHNFMLNNSFHDSVLNKLTVLNNINEITNSESYEVSVVAELTYWDDKKYELLWENVTLYSLDFDITRNKVVETNQILYYRGLDQWSHDELTLTEKGLLHHQIILFSDTKVIIRCKQFSIRNLS